MKERRQSPLAVDDSVWASEAEGEEEVLAAFADETSRAAAESTHEALSRRGPTDSPEPWPRRLLSPHTPMRDVVRTVLIGCLSAMALGASFAIGFGYVWSDFSSSAMPVETRSMPEALGGRPEPLNGDRPVVSDDSTMAPSIRPEPLSYGGQGLDALPLRPSLQPRPSTSVDETVVDPGPAFGVPLQASPRAVVAPESRAAEQRPSGESEILPSQSVLSADSAVIPAPIVPAPVPRASATTARLPAGALAAAGAVEAREPVPRPVVRSDRDAVRETINRYQAAYTRKDVGAMALVWPSLDVAGVAKAFDDVDRQALTLDECHVTTAGKFATAVCPGQVRYIGRVGNRQMQERHGTWTIALERNGDMWQFTRLNVR